MRPLPRQRAIRQLLAAERTRVLPLALRRSPAGADGIYELPLTREAGVRVVAAVEGDAFPIHETARRRRGHAHGVVVIDHPRAAFAHAAGAVVEADGDGLLRDVLGLDLERPKKHRAEVHALERRQRAVLLFHLRDGHPARERGEVGGRDLGVLRLVVRTQEGLADVLDDRVFLRRRVLRLRDHLAEALRQRGVHRVRVRPVFERPLREAQRRRQRARCFLRAVANHAERAVNLRALRERLLVPAGHDVAVITPLQSLHPGRFHRGARRRLDHRTRAAARRRVGKVRRVRARAFAFEKQRDFLVRQRPRPHAHAGDFPLREIAAEVRRRAADLEDIPGSVGLRELRIFLHHLAIDPQLRRARAHGDDRRVRLAVLHLRAAADRADSLDHILQPAFADEQRLRVLRPLAGRRAFGKERPAALRLEFHRRREVRAEVDLRLGKCRRRRRRRARRLHVHHFAIRPHPHHRRALRRTLHCHVMLRALWQRHREVLSQPHHTRSRRGKLHVQPEVSRQLRRIQRKRIAGHRGGSEGDDKKQREAAEEVG